MGVPIVKRYIYKAEWYPVYELHRDEEDTYGTAIQIPQTLVNRYAQAYGDFMSIQRTLSKLYEEKD